MDDDIEFRIVSSTPKVSTAVVDVDDDISSADEKELLEETDIYHGLSMMLADGDESFEELSDLSDNEFEEEQANPAEVEPAQLVAPQPAALVVEVQAEPEPQELEFSDEDLITPPNSPTTSHMKVASSPPAMITSMMVTTVTDAAAFEEDEPVMQGCDPAVMYVTEEELKERIAKQPFPPLPATIRKWRERQASPSMKEYILRIRKDKSLVGPNKQKVFLPYNLRDKLLARKEWQLAIGPPINRRLIIEEYRNRLQRQQRGSPLGKTVSEM